MGGRITGLDVCDVRFPTSLELAGSDATNPQPDYSAAYVVLRTDDGPEGRGLVFTIGRGTDVQVAAIRALEPLIVGLDVTEVLADLGGFARSLVSDSPMRWLGPEKGVVHMAVGAVVNAAWDLYAVRERRPLWKLLADLTPRQLVDMVDFRYLTDVLEPAEALEILERARAGADERERRLLARGFPAYTSSAGWLGYPDEKIARLAKEAVASGFTHLKLKVSASSTTTCAGAGGSATSSGPTSCCPSTPTSTGRSARPSTRSTGSPTSGSGGSRSRPVPTTCGSMEDRWIEYVDHLHEHFVHPVRIRDGRYIAPVSPGSGIRMHDTSLADHAFPHGRVWRELLASEPLR